MQGVTEMFVFVDILFKLYRIYCTFVLQILYCLVSPEQGPPTRFLVMQVRVRTEAPPPQEREHTDHPPHKAHSFMKCIWPCICGLSPPSSTRLDEGREDRQPGDNSSVMRERAWHRDSFLYDFCILGLCQVSQNNFLRSETGLIWKSKDFEMCDPNGFYHQKSRET